MPVDAHILRSIKPKLKGFCAETAHESCLVYVRSVIATQNCHRPKGSSHPLATTCTCLRGLASNESLNKASDVARYMIRWASLDQITKRELLYEWNRFACQDGSAGRGRKFLLPKCAPLVDDGEEDQEEVLICRNALMELLCVGRRMWTTAMNCPGMVHKATGKRSNRTIALGEAYESLNSFFADLAQEAAPFARRVIREETGMTVRDDNPNDVALPPHMTKRRCYARWCWERGWRVTKKNRTLTWYDALADFPQRENDDASEVPLWPTGSESKTIVHWTTFLYFWKANFSHIKIRNKGADTCTDCLVLTNEFRFTRARSRNVPNEDDDDEDNEDDDDDNDNNEGEGENNLAEVIQDVQTILAKAKKHVKQYQTQRNQANHQLSLAKSQIKNKVPSAFRHRVLTIDMGQNLSLPNFEGDQPGDTYYFSPLTVYLFGVVENILKMVLQK